MQTRTGGDEKKRHRGSFFFFLVSLFLDLDKQEVVVSHGTPPPLAIPHATIPLPAHTAPGGGTKELLQLRH